MTFSNGSYVLQQPERSCTRLIQDGTQLRHRNRRHHCQSFTNLFHLLQQFIISQVMLTLDSSGRFRLGLGAKLPTFAPCSAPTFVATLWINILLHEPSSPGGLTRHPYRGAVFPDSVGENRHCSLTVLNIIASVTDKNVSFRYQIIQFVCVWLFVCGFHSYVAILLPTIFLAFTNERRNGDHYNNYPTVVYPTVFSF